ncbi:hypothetical protein [Domibacillus antri]|nr:hypothetical protein [Domibacillus antri]
MNTPRGKEQPPSPWKTAMSLNLYYRRFLLSYENLRKGILQTACPAA